jgi:hypothetical protein
MAVLFRVNTHKRMAQRVEAREYGLQNFVQSSLVKPLKEVFNVTHGTTHRSLATVFAGVGG